MKWRSLLLPLRILVSGGLLTYLIWQSDPIAIWDSWRGAHLGLIAFALLLQFAGVALSAAKWWVLLRARGHNESFKWLLGAYLAGQFANNFLPTTVGGDALRIAQLGRRIGSYSESSASVFVERLTGFVALSVLATLAIVASLFQITGTPLVTSAFMQWLTLGFTAVALAGMAVSFVAVQIDQWIGPRLPTVVRRPLNKLSVALTEYTPRGGLLVLVMALSVLFQLLWIVIHLVCGLALGIDAPFLLYAIMAPVTDILGLAPIFVNNLGAREWVFTNYLAQIGVQSDMALALAFMIFAVRLVISILGGLVVLFGGADFNAAQPQQSDTATSK